MNILIQLAKLNNEEARQEGDENISQIRLKKIGHDKMFKKENKETDVS